jgi:two-component system, NtrC family, sensor kinase
LPVKPTPPVKELQINDLIEEVINLSTQRARYSNATVNTYLDPNLPMIPISSTEFQQVLLNLINNAMDAMEKTGGNLISVLTMQNDDIIITLADTGPGIPGCEFIKNIRPFFYHKTCGQRNRFRTFNLLWYCQKNGWSNRC